MLKKEYRLKTNSAFRKTYTIGRRFSGKHFLLFVGLEKPLVEVFKYHTKIGFVCSKKAVHKRAVKRNRAKRIARESFRLLLKTPEYKEKIDRYISIVVVLKAPTIQASVEDFKAEVIQLFSNF